MSSYTAVYLEFGIWNLEYIHQSFYFTGNTPITVSKRIEIPLSKAKLAKLLVFSVCFLVGGIWMITTDSQTSNPVFNNPVLKALAAYGSTIMGSLGIYFFTKKIFDKKPGLVLSEKGIYDNTSAFKFGLIPWADISAVYERILEVPMGSKQRFVTIGLVRPEKYISMETNVLKRKLLEANAKNYGSPIHISTNGLKMNHPDLLQLMNEYFEKYKPSAL
jgi:hypothetical protein